MRQLAWVSVAVLVVAVGCSTANHRNSCAADAIPQPYVRVSNVDSNKLELQIAVRKFVPDHGRGPVIWLTGVSHIGETNYYEALQKHLDARTLVLFEGVGEHAAAKEPSPAERTALTRAQENSPSLQSTMAASLGLEFQLEAIDYTNPRFKNSDLSIPELRTLMAKTESTNAGSGGSPAKTFDTLVDMMQGGTLLDSLLQFGMRVIGSDPKLRGMCKLALLEMLGEMKGDPAQLGGLPPDLKQLLDVLVRKRNEKVVSDLKSELRKFPRQASIALFYGTGHMPDLERNLRKTLKYRPAEQLWFTAISVDFAQAQISAPERQFIHTLIQSQMRQLKASP